MVVIKPLFMSCEVTAVISVVVLQNGMDLVQGEPGSCDESCGTCTLGGNRVTSIEAERVSHMANEEDEKPATIPAIKTEPNISFMHLVSVMQISYRLYVDLLSPISVCHCEINLTLGN